MRLKPVSLKDHHQKNYTEGPRLRPPEPGRLSFPDTADFYPHNASLTPRIKTGLRRNWKIFKKKVKLIDHFHKRYYSNN